MDNDVKTCEKMVPKWFRICTGHPDNQCFGTASTLFADLTHGTRRPVHIVSAFSSPLSKPY